MAERQVKLDFVSHMVAIGRPGGGDEAVLLLIGQEPQTEAVVLGCPHTCDRLIEQLREARAAIWPHPLGGPDESDEFYAEQVAPGVEATYLAGQAQGDATMADVQRAVARHERGARMLRKWLDAAERDGG